MKTVFVFLFSIIFLSLLIETPAQSKEIIIGAYLTVSIQDQALTDNEITQADIENKIKDALSAEGIRVLPKEDLGKPGESNLNIYVILKDSLRITASRFLEGGNNALQTSLYPEKVYAYFSYSDMMSSVQNYVKDYIRATPQNPKKKK